MPRKRKFSPRHPGFVLAFASGSGRASRVSIQPSRSLSTPRPLLSSRSEFPLLPSLNRTPLFNSFALLESASAMVSTDTVPLDVASKDVNLGNNYGVSSCVAGSTSKILPKLNISSLCNSVARSNVQLEKTIAGCTMSIGKANCLEEPHVRLGSDVASGDKRDEVDNVLDGASPPRPFFKSTSGPCPQGARPNANAVASGSCPISTEALPPSSILPSNSGQKPWTSLFRSLPRNASVYNPVVFKIEEVNGVLQPPPLVIQAGIDF